MQRSRRGIARREFLAAGSAGVAIAWGGPIMTGVSRALGQVPLEGPLVIVNLLKFNENPGGGREAYMRYATPIRKLGRQRGSRTLFYGRPLGLGASSPFDEIVVNEYPSMSAFREMTSSPEFQAVTSFRTQGLQAGGGEGYTGATFLSQPLNWEGVLSHSDRPYTISTGTESENARLGPIVMLNLNNFKEGGRESYRRYLAAIDKIHEAQGSRALYRGRVLATGAGDSAWDSVALVEYPSIQVFAAMRGKPEFQEITPLRLAGIERATIHRLTPLALPDL